MTTHITSPAEIDAMRDWIDDVFGDDCAPELTADLTDAEVHAAIDRYYIGGVGRFLADERAIASAIAF